MITPSLHPSEIRAPARKRTGRKLRLAAGLGFAAAFVAASFAAGAYFLGALPEEPPATVTFNRIEDWPEIKNGVPELAPRKSARVEPAPIAATPSLVPPPPADALPVELRGSAAQAADSAGKVEQPAEATSSAAPVPEPAAEPPRHETEAVPAPPVETAAAPAPPIEAPPHVEAPATADAAPAPAAPVKTAAPPRKERVAGSERDAKRKAESAQKPKPRREKVASAPAAAEPAPPAPEPAPPPAPAVEDDRVNVLGLSLPNLLPSRRKIREAVESLGL